MDPRRLLPALTALACLCVVATLVVTVARRDDRAVRENHPAVAAGSGAAAGAGSRTAAGPAGPARILAAWDERRALAWAEGDTAALRELYAVGSRTGAADLRLQRHYLRRGLTVQGMRTQVLALTVVRRSAGQLVLVVTDRVVGGQAVDGTARVPLPADRASTRRIVLVRQGGRSTEAWLVAEARDQASPAASTSLTSSSSKS